MITTTARLATPLTFSPPRFVRQVGLSAERARQLCSLAGIEFVACRPHYLCVDADGASG
jgi:hypothetical protein